VPASPVGDGLAFGGAGYALVEDSLHTDVDARVSRVALKDEEKRPPGPMLFSREARGYGAHASYANRLASALLALNGQRRGAYESEPLSSRRRSARRTNVRQRPHHPFGHLSSQEPC